MSTFGKVAVGVRVASAPDPFFFVSWTGLMLRGIARGDRVISPSVARPHAPALNYLCVKGLASGCDTLLLMDDDMIFPPDTLARLRATDTDADILSALFTSRRAPFGGIALVKREGKYAFLRDGKGVAEVDATGMAFTLVRRRVIEAATAERGASDVFQWSNTLGEDGTFCEWAKSKGFKIAVNFDVVVGHRVQFTASWSAENDAPQMDFNPFEFANGNENNTGAVPLKEGK